MYNVWKRPTFQCCLIGLASYIKVISIWIVYTRVGLVIDQDNYSEEFHSMSVQTLGRWRSTESIFYSGGAWTQDIIIPHPKQPKASRSCWHIHNTIQLGCPHYPQWSSRCNSPACQPEHVPPEWSDPISCDRLVHKAELFYVGFLPCSKNIEHWVWPLCQRPKQPQLNSPTIQRQTALFVWFISVNGPHKPFLQWTKPVPQRANWCHNLIREGQGSRSETKATEQPRPWLKKARL